MWCTQHGSTSTMTMHEVLLSNSFSVWAFCTRAFVGVVQRIQLSHWLSLLSGTGSTPSSSCSTEQSRADLRGIWHPSSHTYAHTELHGSSWWLKTRWQTEEGGREVRRSARAKHLAGVQSERKKWEKKTKKKPNKTSHRHVRQVQSPQQWLSSCCPWSKRLS